MRTFAIFALALALAGCASDATQVANQQAPQFQRGITTEADVIAALGKPNATLRKKNGATTIAYWHVAARPNAAAFVPIVGASVEGAKAKPTTVSFNFGPDGRLLSSATATSNSDVQVSR